VGKNFILALLVCANNTSAPMKLFYKIFWQWPRVNAAGQASAASDLDFFENAARKLLREAQAQFCAENLEDASAARVLKTREELALRGAFGRSLLASVQAARRGKLSPLLSSEGRAKLRATLAELESLKDPNTDAV